MAEIRTRSPFLESSVLIVALVVAYTAAFIAAGRAETPPEGGMSLLHVTFISLGFLFLSFAISIVAVVAGIGGGVLFTPIMLAFTSVDSLIVRSTGLIVAMFTGLVASGPFMRTGLANLRVSVLLATSYGLGAFGGATGAIYVASTLGEAGEGFVRTSLGLVLASLGVYFVLGGKKVEWPEVKRVDGFTEALNLGLPYYEKSVGRMVNYRMTRAGWTILVIGFVGVLSGFFGLGAGWAIVPVQNLVMAVPLKVAAANSSVLLGMGDCVAVWPYLLSGSVIPLFVAPWLAGQRLGCLIGAHLLASVKAGAVRLVIIGIMFFTSYGLLARGLSLFGLIPPIPAAFTGVMFVAVVAWVIAMALRLGRQAQDE